MAATWDWEADNGAATGSPPKGTTRTTGMSDNNWKNIDDSSTVYSASPIQAGANSFERWIFGKFSGSYNMVLSGLWTHTLTSFGTGLTLKGKVAPSGGYTTPAVAANSNLTIDMTAPISIASGQTVLFGATGPEVAQGTNTASITTNPAYTQWLTSQLQTTVSAVPGDTAQVTMTMQYQEN